MGVEQKSRRQNFTEKISQNLFHEGVSASAGVMGAPLLEAAGLEAFEEQAEAVMDIVDVGVRFLKTGNVPGRIKDAVTITGPVLEFGTD